MSQQFAQSGTKTTFDELSSNGPATRPDSASIRERCATLRIEWTDEAPSASAEAVSLIEPEVAVRLRVVPLRMVDGRLMIAMMDPLDIAAVDEISTLTGHVVTRIGVDPQPFSELMRTHYGTTAARIAESLAELEHNLDAIDAADIHRMAEQPTLINLVNLVLLEAVQSRASDVHIEPFENELKVKFRIDGELTEQVPPPKHLQPALIGRIKIMHEHR